MKLIQKLTLILGFVSSAAFAVEYKSPLEHVKVLSTELQTLSIQNLSSETLKINIYGEHLTLPPASGSQIDCKSHHNLELQIINNNQDYFEVPCQSRVIFTELFMNEGEY